MSIWRRLWARIAREPDANLAAELEFHLEMEAAQLEKSGLSPAVAREVAHRRLGGVDRYTEELRDVRGGRVIDALAQDARYGFRMWKRFPGFTIIVLLTLGVSIGANAAIFSVIDAVLLRPLPFPASDRLTFVYAQNPDKSFPRFGVSYADLIDWRRQTHTFAGMAAFTSSSLTLVGDNEPERLSALSVTADYFDVLGARARFGRLIRPTESDAETASEVVLTHGFWASHFAGDSNVIGRPLKLASGSRTIIGVLPEDFDLDGRPLDAIIVLVPSSIPAVEDHSQHMVSVIGRLRPGVTLAAAQQDLAAVAARLAQQYPSIAGWSTNVFFARDELVRTIKQPLLVLFAAAGLVLLIGCINVANLLLTRSSIREREVALRQALGASRGRLVAQLLVESAALALGGAAIGLALARALLRVILYSAPTGLLPTDIGIDTRVLTFALVLTLLTTVGVGLWPAFRATKPRIAGALHEGGRAAFGGMRALRARRVLVVAETSLALVLLISAGLVVQSLGHILRVDPGFRPEHVAMVRVTLPDTRYHDTTQVQFFRDLQARLQGRGGIDAMAAANTAPIAGGGIVTPIRLLHTDRPDGGKLMANATAVTPGYFQTLRIPVLQGRDVAWSDARATLVVSQSAAKLFWPGQSAVGKRIGFGDRDTTGAEVVGVVGDTHARGIIEDVPPMIYLHYRGATSIARTMTLVVRGRGDDAAVIATTRQAVLEIDRTLPIYAPNSVSALISQSLGQPRLNTTLLSLFAGVALLLAVIGIYGVISYSVTQRAQEIGVRMALGAQQRDVLRLVLREGASLAAIGVAIGVAGAFLATPLIRNWLFGIESSDPATMLGTSLTLVLVALAASYLPARRAARVDPLVAMRAD